jgi:hypothetical protein
MFAIDDGDEDAERWTEDEAGSVSDGVAAKTLVAKDAKAA